MKRGLMVFFDTRSALGCSSRSYSKLADASTPSWRKFLNSNRLENWDDRVRGSGQYRRGDCRTTAQELDAAETGSVDWSAHVVLKQVTNIAKLDTEDNEAG